MASPELGGGDSSSYDFHLRSLSAASRDSAAAADPASDPNILQSVIESFLGTLLPMSGFLDVRILSLLLIAPFFFSRLKVRRVCEMCREAKGARDEMVARAFPVMSKLFQRCATAPTQAVASTGALLLVSRLFLSVAQQRFCS
jgi:AP-5 complex subunit zeta-1